MPIAMKSNAIVNVVIGASCLKIIHCEKRDSDIIIKNCAILETKSNLYLNKDKLNIGFIEDKLRVFLFENKIKSGKICFMLPDYLITTKIVIKQQILTDDYITGLVKAKQLHELLDENISDEEELVFDCQTINQTKQNSKNDTDGVTDVMVSYTHNSFVKALKQMGRRLKMTPSVLEAESSGFIRLIDMFNVRDNYMFLDIGEVYSKIIVYYGTSSVGYSNIDFQINSAGVYTLDNLLSKLFRCPTIVASEKRKANGLKTENEQTNEILKDVVKDVFSMPIVEHLSNIQTRYGGLHFINKFLISGGAWNIPGFKEILYENTLGLYNTPCVFEDYSSFASALTYDNDLIKNEIISNINSYASCLGLCLRGGM